MLGHSLSSAVCQKQDERETKMKNLITQDIRHLLWKDEIGNSFLLLRFAEIYKYSEAEIGIYCWNKAGEH